MEIIIDNREKKLITEFTQNNYEIKVKQLPLGDIIITRNSTENIVIERKTISDLASSNVDGRFREQRARLIENYVKKGIKVIYLIEGFNYANNETRLESSTALSIFVNLMIRDNISVYHTRNVNESYLFIRKLAENIPKIIEKSSKNEVSEYISTIKLKKKDNIRPENYFSVVLCQIPNVSPKIALKITEKYPNISAIISEYSKLTEKESRELLQKKCGLGKILSARVFEYIFG